MVTLYDDNFGTCLQAFALYNAIKELGCKPIIIRYNRGNSKVESSTGLSRIISRISDKNITQIIQYIQNRKFIAARKAGFAKFKSNHFEFSSEQLYRDSDLTVLLNDFDTFVCGSDMIWSEEFEPDWDFFYINFADTKRKIAFSPSFGKNEMTELNMAKSKELIEKFAEKQRSCRDETGVAMIREKFGLTAYHTLDPTMLFDKQYWLKKVENQGRLVNESYTLTYAFGGLKGPRHNIFRQVAKWNLGQTKTLCDFTDKNSISGIVNDPFAFLRAFRDAEFIMTDTFHGLIFSLLFEKPFVCMEREDGGHWAKYADRMISTLKMLGLEDRYVNSKTNISDNFKHLDYTKVNEILNEKRVDSWNFLKTALEESLS